MVSSSAWLVGAVNAAFFKISPCHVMRWFTHQEEWLLGFRAVPPASVEIYHPLSIFLNFIFTLVLIVPNGS